MTDQQEAAKPTEIDSSVDIRRYLQVLLKRKWLILSTLVVVVGVVATWTFTRTRIFRATATILVDQEAPQVLGKGVGDVVDTSMGSLWRKKDYMETQLQVISSRALASKVVERLKLVENRAFWSNPEASPGSPKKRTVKDAVKRLRGVTMAKAARQANMLAISAEHPDPDMAVQLANALTQAYLDQTIEYRFSSASGAVRWLADQLDDLKKQLGKSEMALYEFKKTNNIISVSLEDKQTLIARSIEKINDALTAVRLKRMAQAAQRKQLLAARQPDPLKVVAAPVMESQTVRAIKNVYVEENRRYMALRQRYGERWPTVLESKAKLDAARKDLEREIKNEFAAADSRYRQISDNEAELAAALQKAKDEALELNRREVDYLRLKRTQENTAKLYSLVLTRMKESDLSAQLRVSNIRLLDQALLPEFPVKPRVQVNMLIGLVLGLFFGIGLAFLVDMLDNTVKSQDELEQVAGLVFLGLMPRIPGSPSSSRRRPDPVPDLDLVVHRSPKSVVAESCRSIRTNILFASADTSFRTMLVTSPGPREGKTTTAVSLAIAMAQAGSRVLIVDTDMRRPRLHKVFGVPGGEGITTVLVGEGGVDDVVRATEVPGLSVLPSGPIPPNPAELCQGERFKVLVAELGEKFDRVIFDSPPVMVVTDAVVLATVVDGTLLVARTGQTSREGIRETTRQIQDVSGRILGCVLNDMDLTTRGYGYYRKSGYRYYRYGYGQYGEKEKEAAS